MQIREIKSGETLKCSSTEEMLGIMDALEKAGYATDCLSEKDGERGLWVEVLKTPSNPIEVEQYNNLVRVEKDIIQLAVIAQRLATDITEYRQSVAKVLIADK